VQKAHRKDIAKNPAIPVAEDIECRLTIRTFTAAGVYKYKNPLSLIVDNGRGSITALMLAVRK
jgi:hypothetical protein